MQKFNTYEIYKCEDCGATYRLPLHNKDILPEGHEWKRRICMEKDEGKIKDPLLEVVT
jgi:hypothetical protein